MELDREGENIRVKGDEYVLSLRQGRADRAHFALRGTPVADLYLASGCNANGQTDVLHELHEIEVKTGSGRICIEIDARSALWERKTFVIECLPDHLEYYYRLYGHGSLDDCFFFTGKAAPDRSLRMSIPHFTRVFNPEPNASRAQYSLPFEKSLIGIRSDKSQYNGNWFFTPGPFCYALQTANHSWLAAGILARPDELNFASYDYLPGNGFGLRLAYEGQTSVSGTWESPHLIFFTAGNEYEAVERYCDRLFRSELASMRYERYDWWNEPIFCGWGEQVNMAARQWHEGGDLAGRAAAFAQQQNYEHFLDRLESKGLQPGIVVVDDKWQDQYGLNRPDAAKWPNMPTFIFCQHQLNRKVLLWLKAWDPEGIPAPECLLNEEGEKVAVNPCHPRFEARLRAQVRWMLSELGADGFKIDFTHKLPSGDHLKQQGDLWGTALLKHYLQMISDEAKQVKYDSLIVAHTANPYFADVVDMIRLNDVANLDNDESYLASMKHRARIARAASSNWLIDTDNWPSPSKRAWREYIMAQPSLGVPSLYYTSGIAYMRSDGQLREEEFDNSDYEVVAKAWERHRRNAG